VDVLLKLGGGGGGIFDGVIIKRATYIYIYIYIYIERERERESCMVAIGERMQRVAS